MPGFQLQEPDRGVAVVNDSTYGHDATRTVRTDGDGGTSTTVRVSPLRAPRFPAPGRPGRAPFPARAGGRASVIGDAVREVRRVDPSERRLTGAGEVAPLVTADRDAVVITAVGPADDGSGDVVVRFHEAHGSRARATPTTGFAATGVEVTDLLERPLADTAAPPLDGDRITVRLRPFQLMTPRLRRA
jgi:alpha-mannosidase